MFCSRCSTKMTVLFTSVVCDRCDPPGGVPAPPKAKEYHVGWIYTSHMPGDGDVVLPRVEKQELLVASGTSSGDFYKVYSHVPFNEIYAAHFVLDEDAASRYNDCGQNAVWLVPR